jgi:uncharacterized RDD family membrane protein YckC
MTLLTCPDCARQLSSSARSCPHCGRPNAAAAETPAPEWGGAAYAPAGEPGRYASANAASPAPRYEYPADAYASAGAYGSAGAPVAYAPEAPPRELECPLCRFRQKNRSLCVRCEERLVEPQYLAPHRFPRVPVDYASFGQRFLALLIDGLALSFVVVVLVVLPSSETVTSVGLLLWVIGCSAYNIGFTATSGQTLGKRVADIQVRRADGGAVGWWEAFLRYLPQLMGSMLMALSVAVSTAAVGAPELARNEGAMAGVGVVMGLAGMFQMLLTVYSIGDIIAFFTNRRHRALHDFIAGTVVVDK